MNTNKSPNVAVGTTKKSTDARQPTWFRRNVRQVCDGDFGCRIMHLETAAPCARYLDHAGGIAFRVSLLLIPSGAESLVFRGDLP